MVAIAMSLSERLSLVDLGAAGNSISNLGSFDMVPACWGDTSFSWLNPFDASAFPTQNHGGQARALSLSILSKVPLCPLLPGVCPHRKSSLAGPGWYSVPSSGQKWWGYWRNLSLWSPGHISILEEQGGRGKKGIFPKERLTLTRK